MTVILITLGLLLLWQFLRPGVALAGLSSLVATITAQVGWTATKSITGSDYSPNSNTNAIKKSMNIGTAVANASAGGSDELYSAISSIGASSSVSLDLSAISDILNQTAGSVARIKGIFIRLLSTTDDSAVGTAASSITIDNTVANALSAQSHSGWFSNANEGTATGGMGDATGSKFDIKNGDFLLYGTVAAAGVLVDATHKIIKLTNNDGAVTAKAQVTLVMGST